MATPTPRVFSAYDHIRHFGSATNTGPMHFYQALGFCRNRRGFPLFEATRWLSSDGVRINLIFHGTRMPNATMQLLDAPIKLPGMTHPAFIG